VQSADAAAFTERLTAVFREVRRVLKASGVFAFTYHHSRAEGWSSVLRALIESGFMITAAHPIKSEMSVAMPKLQAKEPIDLDIILVCRKRTGSPGADWTRGVLREASAVAERQIRRLRIAGRRLSRNDVRVVVMSQLLRGISGSHSADEASALLDALDREIEALIDRLATGDRAVGPAERKAG
jgi:adenine-specific DNA methylase